MFSVRSKGNAATATACSCQLGETGWGGKGGLLVLAFQEQREKPVELVLCRLGELFQYGQAPLQAWPVSTMRSPTQDCYSCPYLNDKESWHRVGLCSYMGQREHAASKVVPVSAYQHTLHIACCLQGLRGENTTSYHGQCRGWREWPQNL